MHTTDSKPGRSVNPLDTERPIGLFSSLKMELSVLITISTIIAFIMAWFLLKVGLSLWIAMPITLAVALGEKLGLPVVHLDQLWWTEGWRNVTREEFDSRLAMAMNMDGWIINGNYSRTMEIRPPK